MMLRKRSAWLGACCAVVAAFGFMPEAHAAWNSNGVVRSSNGNIVHSLGSGNCVRTRWSVGYNLCTAAAVPVARTVLSEAEQTVYFPFDSVTLTSQAQRGLDTVVQKLVAAEDVRHVDIIGHADRLGAIPYNNVLSRKRAEAVKNYLLRQGYVRARVVDTQAKGEFQPETSCRRDIPRSQQIACLSPDRRVELKLRYASGQDVVWYQP